MNEKPIPLSFYFILGSLQIILLIVVIIGVKMNYGGLLLSSIILFLGCFLFYGGYKEMIKRRK
jgi:hypothetical protein